MAQKKQSVQTKSFFQTKFFLFGLAVLLILTILYFAVSFIIADIMTQPYHDIDDLSPLLIAPTHQDIAFTASDGVHLKGWFFTNSNSDRLVIMVTGIGQDRSNEDYHAPYIARDLYSQNYNVMMFDDRSEGKSDLTRLDFGERRGNDVVGAVQYAESQGFKGSHIAILADSMGSISTLMVIEKLNDVGAIVLDSGAEDIKPIIENQLQTSKHVPSIFNPGIFLMAKLFFNIDVDVIKPIRHLALVPNRKILYLHAQHDTFIPVQNSIDLYHASNPASKLVIFPTGDHVETYKTDPTLYKNTVYPWINQELSK